jgi:HEAT repeat protein
VPETRSAHSVVEKMRVFFPRWVSGRCLVAFLGVAVFLFGVAMFHPYPRQSLFGPTIRGKPWCVWEAEVQRYVHREEYEKTWPAKSLRWMGVKPENIDDFEKFTQLFNHAEMLPLLLALAEDRDPKVRECVLLALNQCDQLRDRSALPVLRRWLGVPDSGCRLTAAFAIWQIDPKEPVHPVLLRILDDRNDDSRAQAIQPLAHMSKTDPELFRHFAKYATDEDEGVREDVMLFAQLLGAKALPILHQGLEDPKAGVRVHAINTLRLLGPRAKEAVPALVKRLNDDHKKVRDAAATALAAIEPERSGRVNGSEN